MSAFTAATFGELAPYLADYGYQPVPISPGKKAPLLDDWQTPRDPAHYLPHRDPATGKVTDCRRWGTGILAKHCPAVDLDIKDRELVRALLELAGDILGYAPFRIGAPPKALMPFSTNAPFERITGRWWALPGDDWGRDDYVPHRVEILGDGQQFLAYARHPRGTFYRWRRGEPMDTPLVDLPEIDQGSAKAFLWAAQDLVRHARAVPLRKEEGRWWPCAWEPEDFGEMRPEQTVRRRTNTGGATDRSWQAIEPETLAKLIDDKHASRLKNGGWITACPARDRALHAWLSVS